MVPAGPLPLTEQEYWRDYEIIKNDVNVAMHICYMHRAIEHLPTRNHQVSDNMDYTRGFWHVTSSTLQSMLFITLARILDHDGDVHSIHKLLNATIAHPEFFSKAARRARYIKSAGPLEPAALAKYDRRNTWEPTVAQLRAFKKDLRTHKAKFDEIYKPIRNHVAHIIQITLSEEVQMYGKTFKPDIDQILCFLHGLVNAIWDMAYHGEPNDINSDGYGFATERSRISKETKTLLRGLSYPNRTRA